MRFFNSCFSKGARVEPNFSTADANTANTVTGVGAGGEAYLLTEEHKAAREELTRILSMNIRTSCIPGKSYGHYIKLATDKDKMSLVIIGASIERYAPMFLAAVRFLLDRHPGETITIRAFQSPSFLLPGKKLGECVSLSYVRQNDPDKTTINKVLVDRGAEVGVTIIEPAEYEAELSSTPRRPESEAEPEHKPGLSVVTTFPTTASQSVRAINVNPSPASAKIASPAAATPGAQPMLSPANTVPIRFGKIASRHARS